MANETVESTVQQAPSGIQINPNVGPMKVDDGEIIFLSEYEKLTRGIIFDTDSYKPSMGPQYPPEVCVVNSYGESRGGEFEEVMHVGVQPYLDKLHEGVNMRELNIAREMWEAHGVPFRAAAYDMWKRIVNDFGGRIPLAIRAVPEGSVMPTRNPLFRVWNTGGKSTRGLTTWIETPLLRSTWYMSSVATTSWQIRQLIAGYYDKAVDDGTNDPGFNFRLHDFGARGVSSQESAQMGGAAHILTGWMGTDTYVAVPFLVDHYSANPAMTAFSIPAMEHSTVTAWGKDREEDAVYNMVETYGREGGLVAAVGDSYNIYNFTDMCTKADGKIAKLVKERKCLLVLRPDSGEPQAVLPEMLKIIERNAGSKTNKMGYKVLNDFRIIWGDGIDMQQISRILNLVVNIMGYSPENFAFGMGGALLQVINRDSQQYAMKCSAVQLDDGSWRNVYKQPLGVVSKNSKQGLVETFFSQTEDALYVRDIRDTESIERLHLKPLMETVFEDGKITKKWSIEEVRHNATCPFVNATQGHSAGVYAPMV